MLLEVFVLAATVELRERKPKFAYQPAESLVVQCDLFSVVTLL